MTVTAARAALSRPHQLVNRFNWAGLVAVVILVVLWQVVVSAGLVSDGALPSPSQIWSGLISVIGKGTFWPNVTHTVTSIVMAWTIAVVGGVILGVAIGLNDGLYSWTMATIDVLRSIPILAFMPIVFLLWGTSTRSEIIIAAYGALWPVLVSTARNVGSVNARLFDVSQMFQFSRWTTFIKVIVPATAANTVVAARLSLGIAVIGAVTMESIGTPIGVGYQVVFLLQGADLAPMWAYILVTGVIGLVLNAVFLGAVRWLFPGVSMWAAKGRS